MQFNILFSGHQFTKQQFLHKKRRENQIDFDGIFMSTKRHCEVLAKQHTIDPKSGTEGF